MGEQEKKDIQEMVRTAKYLAEHDPKAFALAKNSMDILKVRADMDRKEEVEQRELVLAE